MAGVENAERRKPNGVSVQSALRKQCRCAVTCTVSSRRKILYRLSGISSKRFWKHDIREARREVDELL